MQITPTPTDDEAAVIAAVIAIITAEAQESVATQRDDSLHAWVQASRSTAQRSSLQRGPWRLSGRIGRRSRV